MEKEQKQGRVDFAKLLKGELGLVLILVALCIVFAILSPHFLSAKNLFEHYQTGGCRTHYCNWNALRRFDRRN